VYGFDVEIYGFIMKSFAPNRKKSSCQEMIGQYLRGCSMGYLWVLGTGYWVESAEVNCEE